MSEIKAPSVDRDMLRAMQEEADRIHSHDPAFKRSAWIDLLIVFVIAILVAVSLNLYFFQVIQVDGISMEPTFFTAERVIAEKLSYDFRAPKRGEVVICKYKEGLNAAGQKKITEESQAGKTIEQIGPDVFVDGVELADRYFVRQRVIKRVIGLPGETVSIQNGQIYINGEVLDESEYWNDRIWNDMEEVVIPEKSIFVVGDNRNHSWDSRYPEIGSIPMSRVTGRVVWVIWPFSSFGYFNGQR